MDLLIAHASPLNQILLIVKLVCWNDISYSLFSSSSNIFSSSFSHQKKGTWFFPGDVLVNGTNPLNLGFDKGLVNGALIQTENGVC